MGFLPKGTANGQIVVWDEALQAWVLNGAPAYPPIDEFDTMRWLFLASSISGVGIANEGTAGSGFDLLTSNQGPINDPTPPDVWDVPVGALTSGASTKVMRLDSPTLIDAPDMSNGLTVSGWTRLDGALANDDYLIAKQTETGGTGAPNAGIVLRTNSSGTVDCTMNNGGGTETLVTTSANEDAVRLGSWSHVGCTIDIGQNTLRVYVNGTLSNSGAIIASAVWGDGPWTLGGRMGQTGFRFDGFLFDWRVAETVRDLAWFRAMYTARHLPEAGLS